MKNVIIACDYSDVHADAVCWGLNQVGVEAEVVDLSLLHELARFDLQIDESTSEPLIFCDGKKIDAFWLRRLPQLETPSNLSQHVAKHVYVEMQTFRQNLLYAMAYDKSMHLINPYDASLPGEAKYVQQVMALRAGLNTPDTIISSEFSHIHDFLQKRGRVVVKPFVPHQWRMKGQNIRKVATANKISYENFMEIPRASIQSCSSIYQGMVDKTEDIRVAVIGDKVFAASIRSDDSCIDSRFVTDSEFRQYDLPLDLSENLISMMKSMNLDLCAADIVCDSSNNYYFLDLNPAGAMLVMEDSVGMPVLQSLVSYIGKMEVANEISLEKYKKSSDYGKFCEKNSMHLKSSYFNGESPYVSVCS